jgi:predicted  nucleic acid-binding Zn-ribbon protein
MKTKIIIAVLAVACVGLAIGLLAVKKQGADQHNADVSSIVDFSNQLVNAGMKINDLNQVNLMLTNDLAASQQQAAQLSNNLAAATAAIADGKSALASAQDQITNLNVRLSDLEVQNRVLDQRASELTNTIAKLNSLIDDTRAKLTASETNSVFLQQELQKEMAQKAEIEHKFNDLDALRAQVRKVKTDLFVARRLQLDKNGSGTVHAAQLLIQRTVPATNAPPVGGYGLNVEVGSDGSVKVIPPLNTTETNPNQEKARAALEKKMAELGDSTNAPAAAH